MSLTARSDTDLLRFVKKIYISNIFAVIKRKNVPKRTKNLLFEKYIFFFLNTCSINIAMAISCGVKQYLERCLRVEVQKI